MPQPQPFIVGRQDEVERFDQLLTGQTEYHLLNIYGPGGIGKTVVGQRLSEHAASKDAPMSLVDGNRPDLTPDRMLYGFMQGLLETKAGEQMEGAFRDFDREFRDYLTVNQVLQQGGGIQSLFDVVGNVKEPTGFAAILGGLGSAVTEGVRARISNRFALERYLRGVERILTGSFVEGLQAGMEAVGQPVALLIDTYEEMEGLDDWICRTFMAALPAGVRLVILGRNELHKINFDWNDYERAVHAMPLPELGEAEAKAYLRHFGLTDAVALDQVYRYTGGYPLLLVLVRHLAREAGGWAQIGALESNADRDLIATKLLERILREEQVQEVQAFLEKGVVARWFDPETIGVILEVNLQEARQIYDRLRRHSFVERHAYGLKFHDKIRELLLDRLKFTSESEYNRLTLRLMAYYAEKAGIEQPEKKPESSQGSVQTSGGAYVGGNAEAGGDFVGRDQKTTTYNIHIGSAQGLTIGDHAEVHQQLGGVAATGGDLRKQRRCDDLENHIHETLQLIKEYEDQRRLADDPKVKRRAEQEIANLRSQLEDYEAEQRALGCEEDRT
jgi:hypothetical protein